MSYNPAWTPGEDAQHVRGSVSYLGTGHSRLDIGSRFGGVHDSIEAIRVATGAPGLSWGIMHAGTVIQSGHHGHRDVDAELAPNADTIYGVASLTKSMTASAISILVSSGKLAWNTPVRTILPGLHCQDPVVTDQLSIADLLVHNSGLATSTHWWYGAHGELLLTKDQTLPAFNSLQQKLPFRASFGYSNWPYCIAAEVIEKVSGQTFGKFLEDQIFIPLNMTSTSAFHDNNVENLAKPYTVLDDRTPFLVPYPKTQSGEIMAPAQAVRSSVKDMLAYGSAILSAQAQELGLNEAPPSSDERSSNPLRNVAKMLSGHTIKQPLHPPLLLERSYTLGFHRFQLPQSIEGVSYGTQFVKPPSLAPKGAGEYGGGAQLLIHSGTVAGYTSILALLPEYGSTVFVVSNSLALGDPCGWISQMLIERIIDTDPESRSDWVDLAKQAAEKHASREVDNLRYLEEHRLPGTQPRSLHEYEGEYVGLGGLFTLLVRIQTLKQETKGDSLEILFQGRESQAFPLKHYHHNAFTWLESFNDQARKARFNLGGPNVYVFTFMSSDGQDLDGPIDRVCWVQEPGLPESEQCFLRKTDA